MIQQIDTGWSSSFLLRRIGYCLLVLALFDVIYILIPLRFMNPNWEFQTIGALVERVAVPLLGLGLVFYGESDFRAKWERLPLKFLSWASLLVGVLFILLAPLLLVNNFRIDNQINYQINTQVTQQLSQLEQVENQVRNGTAKDVNDAVARLNQGRPVDIKNPQELKSQLLSEITKAKETIRPQTIDAWAARRLTLRKNAVKWFLGALVSGFLFIYIWRITRWTRRGSKFVKS